MVDKPAENSTKIARVPGRPFAPGQSGNPGGRPKGLAAMVREKTHDGFDLVTFYHEVFTGKKRSGLKEKMQAAEWLADRGFGKPVQTNQHDISDNFKDLLERLVAADSNQSPTE